MVSIRASLGAETYYLEISSGAYAPAVLDKKPYAIQSTPLLVHFTIKHTFVCNLTDKHLSLSRER